jgi:hypothetical protein
MDRTESRRSWKKFLRKIQLNLGTISLKTTWRGQARVELSAAMMLYCVMAMTCRPPQVEAALVQVEAP